MRLCHYKTTYIPFHSVVYFHLITLQLGLCSACGSSMLQSEFNRSRGLERLYGSHSTRRAFPQNGFRVSCSSSNSSDGTQFLPFLSFQSWILKTEFHDEFKNRASSKCLFLRILEQVLTVWFIHIYYICIQLIKMRILRTILLVAK